MTTHPNLDVGELLRRGLEERTAGDSGEILASVLRAAATTSQRTAWSWAPTVSRRLLIVGGVALLLAAMAGALAVGRFLLPEPAPDLHLMPAYHHNGVIVVTGTGRPHEVVDVGGEASAARFDLPVLPPISRISWSPDGMQFAYSGPNVVRIADLSAGTSRLLVDCPTLPACVPAWAPDGREIAVSRGGHVNLMTLDGAEVASLSVSVSPIYALAWSPDGTQLAAATDGFTSFGSSTLYVIKRDGSGLRALAEAAAPETAIVGLAWAPDGSRIAYINTTAWNGTSDVNLTLVGIDPDGTHRQVIADAGACFCLGWNVGGLAWAPDGTLFAVGKPGEGLFLISADGSLVRKVAEEWEYPAWRPVP